MKIILNESQLNELLKLNEQNEFWILNNEKITYDFDKKYGTSISQTYKYPFNLTDDDVWKAWTECKSRAYLPTVPSNVAQGYCDTWDNIINALDETHFPYSGVKSLSKEIKRHILCGMASSFNFDDIVHFSIDGIPGYLNTDVSEEIKKTFPPEIVYDIQWVVSPKTLEKLKEQIPYRREKLNISDIGNEVLKGIENY